jgi:hypothetical protein
MTTRSHLPHSASEVTAAGGEVANVVHSKMTVARLLLEHRSSCIRF